MIMMRRISILDDKNWIFFRIYGLPTATVDWKIKLDWYHEVLRKLVKPIVDTTKRVRAVFFGIYGPRKYELGNPKDYERMLKTIRFLHFSTGISPLTEAGYPS